jgi:bifunctional non-homologous end joining protein LigD
VILDGEIVVLNDKGISDFQLLQNYLTTGKGIISYFVFDLLYLDGKDLRSLPLVKRKKMLRELLPELSDIRYSDHLFESGKSFFELAKENNLEGIIAKHGNSRYYAGKRSREWLKIKIKLQQEAVICGFSEPKGSRKYFGALVLGVYEKGELVHIGMSGGGFDQQSLKDIYGKLQPLVQKSSPFTKKIGIDTRVQWVRPVLVCEVSFTEWTDEKIMRHPVFLGLSDRELVHFSREPRIRGRIVFVEDYDMDVATQLVTGVDVWLNNPRRPLAGGLRCRPSTLRLFLVVAFLP